MYDILNIDYTCYIEELELVYDFYSVTKTARRCYDHIGKFRIFLALYITTNDPRFFRKKSLIAVIILHDIMRFFA